MFCGKCGKKIEDKVKFCPYCGTPVDQKMATGKKNTRKIVGAILVIAIIAAAALLWSQRKSKDTYEDYLAEAEQYLSELKYEQAEDVLKYAIEIKPERKEAYISLAYVYEADDKKEDAVNILETSLKQAKLQEEDKKEIQGYIENIQNGVAMKGDADAETKEETNPKQPENVLTDYLQNTLIPDEGKIEEVAETKDFEMSENISEVEQKKLLIGDGIAASFIEDMDGDGQKELHVFRNESVNEDSNYYNRIFWEVYVCEGNDVKKTASQEILQYQSLYADEIYNIYLKKNNGYRYIYSEADGVSMDAKMERVQSVFSYTGDKIKIEKSLVTTGGNGGFVDIYDSDSVYLPYAKRWVNGEEDKNKDAKEYYVYGDGKNYSDFDSYLEGYSSALRKELFDYGISMPITEQTTAGQYPFFDIYLANAAKFDENLFNYRLQTDPYEYYENGKELEYTRIIKSIQVDTGKSEEDTDENATKSDEDSKKQGWRQAYIDFINSKEIQNEDYAEYMLMCIDDDDIPELLASYGTEAEGEDLCYYDGENLQIQWIRMGSVNYIEKDNLVCASSGHMDNSYDTVYTIKNGKFEEVCHGMQEIVVEEHPVVHYYWNDEEVSEDEYYADKNAVFDSNIASSGTPSNTDGKVYTKQEILDYLNQ